MMKRLFCAVLALALLMTATLAMAEKITVFTDPATGAKVTLELEGEYNLEYDEHCTEDYTQFTVSRDGVCPVVVVAYAADTEDINMNDMTEEQLAEVVKSINDMFSDENYTVTVEKTASGNTYINIASISENGSFQERFTIFEDFNMSRTQFSDGLFTEADDAFIAEVQGALWVEK